MTRQSDLAAVKRRTAGNRFLLVDRPTLVHGRSKQAGQCPCGCQSWSLEDEDERGAWITETIPGPQLLIDRWRGKRWLRSEQSEIDGTLARFDRLAAKAERIYMPRRCYPEQLVALEAKPKVKGIFGGSRGGKTQLLGEECGDEWMAVGGRGVRLWWVAPRLADTKRAIRKLVTGEAIKGGSHGETRPALFHPKLIADYPKTLEQIKREKPITLIDGTEIELRYAGTGKNEEGGNLKGDAPAWMGVDEGAEIMSPGTWATMVERMTDSRGRITTSTTPVIGSPLKHLVFDEGQDIAVNDDVYLTGYIHLTMRSNPWIVPKERERTIATLRKQHNGDDLIKMRVDGQWVVPGGRMWEHFDESAHVVIGPWREVERYKVDGRPLRNITALVAAKFFNNTTAPNLDRIAGQDFNLRGHFTVVLQVGVPEGLDEGNPDNWVVYVEDEVKKAGEPREAARFLRNQAGAKRGLRHDYFAGLAISCDAQGAQDRLGESATGNVAAMFTFADEYIRAGFDMRPCHRTDNDKPANPEKLAQQQVLHALMVRHDKGQDAKRYADGDPTAPPSVRLLINKARCPELIKGLREQARTEKGFLRKRSDTRDDRLSDPVDALLYGLWPHFVDPSIYPSVKVYW